MRSDLLNADTQTLPLSGIRVIELGAVVAGPFCGGLLADYGAEVIKVEPVGVGDSHRQIGRRKNGVSLWWGVSARSKQCISLNLKDPESMSLLLRLLDSADVVTENFRPGVMDRLGLGWDVLSRRNPRLTMLSISGYGQTGPKSSKPGFGKIAEGLSGMLPLTGSPISNAVFVGFSLADTCAAMFGVFGIMMSLYLRDLGGGRGRFIDLALYESLLRMLDCQFALQEHASHGPRARRNNPYAWGEAGERPEQFIHIRSKSGQWLAVLVLDQKVEAAIRSRFCNEGADVNTSLEAMLLAWGKTQTSEEVLSVLKPLGAEIAPVFDGLSIAREPYFRARGDVLDTESEIGPLSVPGPYPKPTTRLATMNRFKPTAVGADNQAVLGGELGVSDVRLEELKIRGAI
jgi:crotonobetainyl-CoA:carnitine CoA-transferase CaiB-like acyl-CoA transferase